MNEQMKELVAMGAAAVKVGLMVNRGAENAIRKKTRELLGEAATDD